MRTMVVTASISLLRGIDELIILNIFNTLLTFKSETVCRECSLSTSGGWNLDKALEYKGSTIAHNSSPLLRGQHSFSKLYNNSDNLFQSLLRSQGTELTPLLWQIF